MHGAGVAGRLDRDDELRNDVLSKLQLGWSPEAVAGRLMRERGKNVISYESIYRFIYAQIARTKDYSWRNLLRRGKWRRGRRRRGGSSSARTILHRRPLSERPAAVADRSEFGHWEADGMQFGRTGQTVLMLHERRSRLLIAVRRPSRAAAPVAEAIAAILGPLPPEFRQTVTFDNGTEFAHHYELHAWGIETYFCDTYSPWQKGGVENAIGRMRWFLPRKTDLASLSEREFTALLRVYNNTPRKCLDYRTPVEVLREQVLHFECESTFLPAQERRGCGSGEQGEELGGDLGYEIRGGAGDLVGGVVEAPGCEATPAVAFLRDLNVRPAVAYDEGPGWCCAHAGHQAFQSLGVGFVVGDVLEADDMRDVAVDTQFLCLDHRAGAPTLDQDIV